MTLDGIRPLLESHATRAPSMSPWQLVRGNAAFARLWIAQLISMTGDFILWVALSALVYQMSGSASAVSMLGVANNLPYFLAIPLAGAVADSKDRRAALLICNYAQAVIVLGFLAVQPSGLTWLAFPLCIALQTLAACFAPAAIAAVPNLVSRAELGTANALLGSAFGTTQALGAALGGLIVHALGTNANIVIDALTFVVSSLIIHTIHASFSAPAEAPTSAAPAVDETGFRVVLSWLRAHTAVVACLLIKCIWGFGAGALILLTVLPMETLHAGEVGVSILFTARGVGATIGPFVVRRLAPYGLRWRAAACIFSLIGMGGCWLGFARSGSMVGATVWATVLFTCAGAGYATSTTILQELVPDRIRGRVVALDGGLCMLVLTASTWIAGVVSDSWGPRMLGTAFGVGQMVLGALWLAVYLTRRSIKFEAATE